MRTTKDADPIADCEMLRSALNTFYLGEPETSELQAQVIPRSISASEMIATIGAVAPARAPKKAEQTIRFLPIWNASKEVVSTYIATPTYASNDGPQIGYSFGLPLHRAS